MLLCETDSLVLRINELIANVRSEHFSKLSDVSNKALWRDVGPTRKMRIIGPAIQS